MKKLLINLRRNQVLRRQAEFFSSADRLDDSSGNRYMMYSIYAMSLTLLMLIIWMATFSIKEISATQGEVVPANNVFKLQHLEGGLVQNIYVNDGQLVRQGQLLAKLNPTEYLSELNRLRMHEISLMIDIERLRAHLDGKELSNSQLIQSILKDKELSLTHQKSLQSLLNDEKKLLKIQNFALKDRQDVIKFEIKRYEDELHFLLKERDNLKKQIALHKEENSMFDQLKDRDVVSRREEIASQQKLLSAEKDLLYLHSQIISKQRKLSETEEKLSQISSSSAETTREKIAEKSAELLKTLDSINKYKDKVKRTSIYAPVTGHIKGLEMKIGSVISHGGPMLEIVPEKSELMVETKIPSDRIGHIKIGDHVNVKVKTFNFTNFGIVTGKLQRLSPTTFTDGTSSSSYYKGMVKLSHNFVVKGGHRYRLKPGMTVTADIVSGEKTLLQYMLKPLHRTLDKAFTER